MSYLKFDKRLMINLDQSLSKEMLRTNKSGAFHCTSIVDCNTRKQHGLLVIPIPELDDETHVMLSSIDETVIQHGAPFNLGIHKYNDNHFSPNGHKYIREFSCDISPVTIYRVGGVVFSKEKIFVSHENRILIKYTLLEAHSSTTLQLRPLLAFRSTQELTVENNAVDRSYRQVENGIETCLYGGYPPLYMQFSISNEFHFTPYWNKNIEYIKEQERGYPCREDLYVPGYFEMPIKKGESIIFSAGTSPVDTTTLESLYRQEVDSRTPRSNFYNCLKNSAQQFYVKKSETERYIISGFPWFKVRARDQFIALPGVTLGIGDTTLFELIMDTACSALSSFIDNGTKDAAIREIEAPDVLLWAIWSMQQYAKETSSEACYARYGKLIDRILNYIIQGKHPNLFMHDNSLLYTNGHTKAVSWMNSCVNGRPVVGRSGYLVEFNALWYNAVCFATSLEKAHGRKGNVLKWDKLSTAIGASFVDMFLNGHGYLFDFVDGSYADYSVRPNMLFALSLDYSPLDKKQRKSVLDVVTRELLTPKGIRSLSPKSHGYNPNCVGAQVERNYAYHQGTAWPWLMGAYSEAYLKIFGLSGVSFIERMLIGYEEEMTNHGISTISELFDGNPPFAGRGGISFAVNVGEILRVLHLLKRYSM